MAYSVFPAASTASATTPVGGSSLVFSGFMNTGNYTYGSSLPAGSYIVTFYGTAPGARYNFVAPTSGKTTLVITGGTGAITTTSAETAFNIQQNLNGNWTPSQAFGTSNMRSVFFGNGLFLAGGAYGSYSTNGTSWTTISSGVGPTVYFAYGNSAYVVGGAVGEIKSSTDLITWTARTSNTSTGITCMGFGNGLFLYGTSNGGLGTSTDGTTWTARTSGSTNDIFAVGYFNNQYFAIGYDTVRTSPTGTTWTTRTHPFGAATIYSIAYGNNVYVITADSGKIATSTDGITWTLRTSGTGVSLRSVTFGNGIFVAVGDRTVGITSIDGITWYPAAPSIAATLSLAGIAFGNNTFVAVGDTGWASSTPSSGGYITVYTAAAAALN